MFAVIVASVLITHHDQKGYKVFIKKCKKRLMMRLILMVFVIYSAEWEDNRNITDLQKIFRGYDERLFEFICLHCPGWAINEVIDMAKSKKSEAWIIEKCFEQMNEGVFDSKAEADKYQEQNRAEAKKKYLQHCNPDGTFRFEDFLI